MERHLVVDASVAAKWILAESGSEAAWELLDNDELTLHAPELCIAELTNTLWKRVRRGELKPFEAIEASGLLRDLPMEEHAHKPIVLSALAIALQQNITVYDALYVALALSLETTVITADRRLMEAGAGAGDWPVRLL
jgi:predicted nucleic acid-binding protein